MSTYRKQVYVEQTREERVTSSFQKNLFSVTKLDSGEVLINIGAIPVCPASRVVLEDGHLDGDLLPVDPSHLIEDVLRLSDSVSV